MRSGGAYPEGMRRMCGGCERILRGDAAHMRGHRRMQGSDAAHMRRMPSGGVSDARRNSRSIRGCFLGDARKALHWSPQRLRRSISMASGSERS
jgi:hypothetical protein